MTDEALWRRDAVELASMIRHRRVSSREVVESHLQRLQEVNPTLNAVVLVLADRALEAADRADEALARGEDRGILHGVPITTKVNTDQAGCPSDNGVPALRDKVAERDNPVVANLKKAGAIVLGRTNTPAYSMRWFTDNELHGATLNPWDASFTPGGSSGGAAVSVAAGMAPIGQGNDIAGSVRYPAYCCGLVGLRPSYGRVPTFNPSGAARPISAQLMSVQGPLTRTVRDARLALAAMAAGDPNDAKWVGVPLEGPAPAKPLKVALVDNPAGRGVLPQVKDAVRLAGRWLQEAGCAVEEVEPPELGAVADLWPKLAMDDFIRTLEPGMAEHGGEGIRKAVGFWRQAFPPAGAEGVLAALTERDRLARLWQLFFAEYPLVLMPVSGEQAFPVGLDLESFAAFERIWTAQLPQLAVPVLGLPAVSVPIGVERGLPLGVQIVGPRYREDLCLAAAEWVEARADMVLPFG